MEAQPNKSLEPTRLSWSLPRFSEVATDAGERGPAAWAAARLGSHRWAA